MTKHIISSLPPLQPTKTYEIINKEVQDITIKEHNTAVTSLIEYVINETTRLFNKHSTIIINDIQQATKIGSANSFARQKGYTSNYKQLPRNIKAKSRINELILHKLVTETASYVNNPNPRKQEPSFNKKINLGAIDKQMSSISLENNTLTLLFKAWDKELLIEFHIPEYFLKKNILKWCLPTIQIDSNGEIFYRFSIKEKVQSRKITKVFAGVDLGRVKPFTLAIVNYRGDRIADYTAKHHVKELNLKRERILKEKKHIITKIKQYEKLGLSTTVLELEAKRKATKASRLGEQLALQVSADITSKLVKHEVNTVAVEDLSWVTGPKYGSKWCHSKQQSKLEHSLKRDGVKLKKVNPKNTSQSCCKCGSRVVHNSKKRTVFCRECLIVLDRDFNASMGIARKLISYPNLYSRIGDNCRERKEFSFPGYWSCRS